MDRRRIGTYNRSKAKDRWMDNLKSEKVLMKVEPLTHLFVMN
jgi:hypothetical protein